jgi:hypothetical protein
MIDGRRLRALRIAAVLAVIALSLMVWSLVHPRPLPVIVAMSLGQALGTLSFATFIYVVVADFRSGPPKDSHPRRRRDD